MDDPESAKEFFCHQKLITSFLDHAQPAKMLSKHVCNFFDLSWIGFLFYFGYIQTTSAIISHCFLSGWRLIQRLPVDAFGCCTVIMYYTDL